MINIKTVEKLFWMLILDINECESNPCENGGTCTDMEDGYSCACESGFTGSECESGTLISCLLFDYQLIDCTMS